MFRRRRYNFFARKLNIMLFFFVIFFIVLFFFLEWFVPIPEVEIEKIIEKTQFKN